MLSSRSIIIFFHCDSRVRNNANLSYFNSNNFSMTFVMATEAQRLISISLAKIAASRCVRGGVSLHKNLLVATVLQKARYIFMEEAFHMVHGTYLNQANSKFIQQLREQERIENELRHCERGDLDDDDDTSHSSVSPSLDDSDLDIFSTPINSNENLNFLNDTTTSSSSSRETGNLNNLLLGNKFSSCLKESNPSLASTSSSSSSTDLIYLDLDINNRVKPQDMDVECCSNSSSISGQKRRHCESDFETEEAILSILPKSKQIKLNNNDEDLLVQCTSDLSGCNSDHIDVVSNHHHHHHTDIITTDNCLSLDFLSNDLSLASSSSNSPTHSTSTANLTMAPLDMSCNSNSNSSSINNNTTTTTQSSSSSSSSSTTTTLTSSLMSSSSSSSLSTLTTSSNNNNTSASSIDRITSLVSIFNFGNLQRSVSTPDLCSSASSSVESSCCTNLSTQHQIAMTV